MPTSTKTPAVCQMQAPIWIHKTPLPVSRAKPSVPKPTREPNSKEFWGKKKLQKDAITNTNNVRTARKRHRDRALPIKFLGLLPSGFRPWASRFCLTQLFASRPALAAIVAARRLTLVLSARLSRFPLPHSLFLFCVPYPPLLSAPCCLLPT